MTYIPHEFSIGEVYMPPLLVAAFLGLIAAMLTGGYLYDNYRNVHYSSLIYKA